MHWLFVHAKAALQPKYPSAARAFIDGLAIYDTSPFGLSLSKACSKLDEEPFVQLRGTSISCL